VATVESITAAEYSLSVVDHEPTSIDDTTHSDECTDRYITSTVHTNTDFQYAGYCDFKFNHTTGNDYSATARKWVCNFDTYDSTVNRNTGGCSGSGSTRPLATDECVATLWRFTTSTAATPTTAASTASTAVTTVAVFSTYATIAIGI
jgi:hypothetical protein